MISLHIPQPAIRAIGTLLRTIPLPRGRRWLANKVGDSIIHEETAQTEVAQMAMGFRMLLDLADPFQRQMFFSGTYEPAMSKVFSQLLQQGDTVVDGGANIGYFSLLAAHHVGKQGRVHAFEPISATARRLRENIALNHSAKIEVNELALSEAVGTLKFSIPVDSGTGKELGWAATSIGQERENLVTVRATTLDSYAAEHNIERFKLVKIDLEGAELSALGGMEQLLSERRITYLLSEVNLFLLKEANIEYDAIRKLLYTFGYRCYELNQRNGHITSADRPIVASSEIVRDYLFVAPGQHGAQLFVSSQVPH